MPSQENTNFSLEPRPTATASESDPWSTATSSAPGESVVVGSGEFKPGLYRHYKGNLYTAICLVAHHEGRYPMVLYVSHVYGGVSVRPLRGVAGDPDGFLDAVRGANCRRFVYVGALPSNMPIADR